MICAPQAVLVANNPYGTSDVAGLNRRARLDRGELGITAVKVGSARQAIALLHRSRPTGLMSLTAPAVTIDADTGAIPVGIDGEAVTMPTPVRCSIRRRALRVRLPRNRPGVQPPGAPVDWARSSAHKPVQITPYLSFPRPGVVIGDQVLTDGLLAKRLGYAFLHYRAPLTGAPIGPQLLCRLGRLARRPVFGSERLGSGRAGL
jgi:hypothetical protein